ncbi:MAG: hypothetical protein QM796_10995 [Chthoniobacteraceae bacterium]
MTAIAAGFVKNSFSIIRLSIISSTYRASSMIEIGHFSKHFR